MKRIYNGVEVTFTNETDYKQSNVVYLITFPDGKYYVGSTMGRLSTRISHHCVPYGHNAYLPVSKAVRNFMSICVKILHVNNHKKVLMEYEIIYTTQYASNNILHGYNIIAGNKSVISVEQREQISNSLRGRQLSELTKQKIKESSHKKAVKDDHDNIFQSKIEAASYYNVDPTTVLYYLKTQRKSKKLSTKFYWVE